MLPVRRSPMVFVPFFVTGCTTPEVSGGCPLESLRHVPTRVSVQEFATMVRLADGSVQCWGNSGGNCAFLSDTDPGVQYTPKVVDSIGCAVDVSIGRNGGAATLLDGGVL